MNVLFPENDDDNNGDLALDSENEGVSSDVDVVDRQEKKNENFKVRILYCTVNVIECMKGYMPHNTIILSL